MSETWTDKNQKYLVACIDEVKAMLRNHIAKANGEEAAISEVPIVPEDNSGALPALEVLSNLFGLSHFERQVLILCAAVELDSEAATLCAQAQGNLNCPHPTFGLALACLPNAHWSALSPASPLRRFRLIEVGGASTGLVTSCPLHIAERVLHYLTGVFYLDTHLQGLLKPVVSSDAIVESHRRVMDKVLFVWKNAKQKLPIIQLWGADESGKLIIAQKASAELGLGLWRLPAELIPQKPDEAEDLLQLLAREEALLSGGLFISAEDAEQTTQKAIGRFTDDLPRPVFISTKDCWRLEPDLAVSMEVNKPLKAEQRQLWQLNLKNQPQDLDATISELVGQFDLNTSAIKTANDQAVLLTKEGVSMTDALWQASRAVSRPRVSELAQQIAPKATVEDLVLPEREKQLLKEIAVHVAQRDKVYVEWGFEGASSRGLGITALFSGPSGTGKTMAAEAIANELHLDLFRIDLSAVVSKYIGETEKNLRKLFDAAEEGGSILFFDEADALFGKRTEVRDSHDRYANIEVNYLLQRMENYRGLAVLATNMREALDDAFVRRIKFIVTFPFPDEKSRMEIWKHIFPKKTPTEELNFERLAKLNIAGGNIRNIALYAAFLAANDGAVVNMRHLKRAIQVEYAKLERPLSPSQAGDW